MRFRIVRRGPGPVRRPLSPPVPEPAAPPRAADLDNPYARYYGRARSLEDLKK